MVNKAANVNDRYSNFLFVDRNNVNDEIPKNKKSGSVIPNVEFMIR